MKQIDLEPDRVRKSEPAGLVLTIWFVLCYAVLTYGALGASGWNWKVVAIAQIPAFAMGYLAAKRFRVERTPAGRNR